MSNKALVGAIALAIGMISPAMAEPDRTGSLPVHEIYAQPGPLVTEAHIAGLRSALRLTSDQQRHWGPVESALRALSRQQRRDTGAGFVQRMSDRASSMAGTAVQLRRLASAARPLISSLSQEQKSSAMQMIRRHGFERMLAMF